MRRPRSAAIAVTGLLLLAVGCAGEPAEPDPRAPDTGGDVEPAPGFVLDPAGSSLSPDGALLAAPCHERLCVWDALDGDLTAEVPGTGPTAWVGPTTLVADAADGSGELALLDVDREEETGRIALDVDPPASGPAVAQLVADTVGRRVAVLAPDGTVQVAGTDPQEEVTRLDVAATEVSDLALDPTGRWLAVASPTQPVELWDLERDEPAGTLGADPATQVDLASPTRAATGGGDAPTTVWDLTSGSEVAEVAPGVEVTDLALSPDGREVAHTTDESADGVDVVRWQVGEDEVEEMTGHSSPGGWVRWSASGADLYSVAPDAVLHWNLDTGDEGRSFEPPPPA